jgi:chromosome partitioning protein
MMEPAKQLPVIAFMNRKGGVGKSTFSVSFAQYESRQGRRVLFMDFDTQQHGSLSLLDMEKDELLNTYIPPLHPAYDPTEEDEWDGRSSTADMFHGREVFPYPCEKFPGLDIVPAITSLRDVEQVRRDEVKSRISDRLYEFLNLPELAALYDVVIIDTPPTENILNQAILRSCTHAAIPFVPESKSVAGVYSFFKLMAEMSRYRRTPLKIAGLIPNLYRRSSLHDAFLQQLRADETIGEYVMSFEVGTRVAIPTLDLDGVSPSSIWDHKPSEKARIEIEGMCQFLEGNIHGR